MSIGHELPWGRTRLANELTHHRSWAEWPTLGLLFGCYIGWGLTTGPLAALSLWLAIPATSVMVAMHSSLQHEIIHGHPTRRRWLNELLVAPPLTLFIPFYRFRDTHLDHHRDSDLTDPYDDPETNYLDADVWKALPAPVRVVLWLNNALVGRLILGPLISQIYFILSDLRAIRDGDNRVFWGWLAHIPAVALLFWWLSAFGAMPLWAYAISAYFGISFLKLRTYAEHRAHELVRARTVIVEDRGPLSLLFLNNNLHAVHHRNPDLAWYVLQRRYRDNRDEYLRWNDGYVFANYGEIFRKFLFRPKDPVAHPLWRQD